MASAARMSAAALLCSAVLGTGSRTGEEAAAIRAVREPMCEAVVSEMHIEIHKHSLRRHGEDDVWETVPAICLAIVQNYTLLSDPWRLQRRAERLDDVDGSPAEYEHLLLLKAACEDFTDEYQHEISGAMFASTAAGTSAQAAAATLCPRVSPRPTPQRKRRRGREGRRTGGAAGKGVEGGKQEL